MKFKNNTKSINSMLDKMSICSHDYEEVSGISDFEGESYKCKRCGHRYRLYYEDMK